MYKSRNLLGLMAVALMAVLIVACEAEPPPPPPNAPPPPPTPEEIRQAARGVWSEVIREVKVKTNNGGERNETLPEMAKRHQSLFSGFMATHGATETGRSEIQTWTTNIAKNMRRFMDDRNWPVAKVACGNLLVLNPDSVTYEMTMAKILREMAKPRVELTGFYKDRAEDKLYVLLLVVLPASKGEESLPEDDPRRRKSISVSVGEEFYGFKLRRVVENQQATVVYLEDNSVYTLQVKRSEG